MCGSREMAMPFRLWRRLMRTPSAASTRVSTRHSGVRARLLLASAGLVLADDVTKTERFDFPAGGTLRLKNSIGELTVEGWDQPGIEITTIKSPRKPMALLDR